MVVDGQKNVIIRISKESTYGKRYHIDVEGGISFSIHEDVLVTYGLYRGMPVDQQQIDHWLEADELTKIRQATYRYLSYRPRTAWEVEQYLQRRDWEKTLILRVLEEMSQAGYIDDQTYAREWVKQRHENKGFGARRLKQELKKKGIASRWIEEALTELDEASERQQAMIIAERRYLRICDEPWGNIQRKIGGYLQRRGYSMSVVYAVMDELYRRKQEES